MARKRATTGRPPLPREHGAWALLYGPFVMAVAVSKTINLPVLLLFLAMTSLFVSHEPAVKALRGLRHGSRPDQIRIWTFWFLAEALMGVGFALSLILIYDKWLLLPLGSGLAALFAAHLSLTSQKQERSLWAELLGVAALTASGPATYYVGTGQFNSRALLLWIFCMLYFSSAVFFVKMRLARFTKPALFSKKRGLCLAYHALMLLVLAFFFSTGQISFGVIFAYLPILVRSLWGAFSVGKLNIKRIGYLEVVYTVIFVVVFSWSWNQ